METRQCCPLCNREWTPPKGLRLVEGRVYWNGESVVWRNGQQGEDWSGGACAYIFIRLYENLGKSIRRDALYNELCGNRIDGGPMKEIISVYLSRIRKAIRHYNLPFEIFTAIGRRGNSDLQGRVMMVQKEPKK